MQKINKSYLILMVGSIIIQVIGITLNEVMLRSNQWFNVWQIVLLVVLIIESKIYIKYPTRINLLTLTGLGGIQLVMLILFMPVLFRQYGLIIQLSYIFGGDIDFYLLILFVIIQIVRLFFSCKMNKQDAECVSSVPKYTARVALIIMIVAFLFFSFFSLYVFSLVNYGFFYYGFLYYSSLVIRDPYLIVWNGLIFILCLSQVVLYKVNPQVKTNEIMYRVMQGFIWMCLFGLSIVVVMIVSYTFQSGDYAFWGVGMLLGLGMGIYSVICLIGVGVQVYLNIKHFLMGGKCEEKSRI